jgi:hypothetical protein
MKRKYAFTSVMEGDHYILGKAHQNVYGYTPVPMVFKTREEANKEADRRNKLLGLTKMEAFEIIGSSFNKKFKGRNW